MKKRLDALQIALDNEKKEREFYLENADRTGNPVGKAMFQQIAEEELEHYERLKQLAENWEKQEKWPETIPLEVKGTKVKDVLKEAAEKAPKTAGDADDLAAIRAAIEFEAKGTEYYAKLSEDAPDPKEKAFFNLLSNIEREHYMSLKDTEEYMIDPVDWFRKVEKGGLDGA